MFRTDIFAVTASTALSFAGGHSMDIANTAVSAGNFTTLVAAVEVQGLLKR